MSSDDRQANKTAPLQSARVRPGGWRPSVPSDEQHIVDNPGHGKPTSEDEVRPVASRPAVDMLMIIIISLLVTVGVWIALDGLAVSLKMRSTYTLGVVTLLLALPLGATTGVGLRSIRRPISPGTASRLVGLQWYAVMMSTLVALCISAFLIGLVLFGALRFSDRALGPRLLDLVPSVAIAIFAGRALARSRSYRPSRLGRNSPSDEREGSFVTGEVRNLETRTESYGGGRPVTVWTFRLVEARDSRNTSLPLIPVEMRGTVFTGSITAGDIVKLPGVFEDGDVLSPSNLYNMTTHSPVACRGFRMPSVRRH